LGIGQYLPVLGGIGIGPILFLVIVPNTGQTTVYSAGAVSPRRSDKPCVSVGLQHNACYADRFTADRGSTDTRGGDAGKVHM